MPVAQNRFRTLVACLLGGVLLAGACGDSSGPFGSTPPGVTSSSGSGGSGASGVSEGGSGGQGGSLEQLCEAICDTKEQLGCADYDEDTCYGECWFAPAIMPWCKSQADTWLRCVAQQPASSFVCQPDKDEKQPQLATGCSTEFKDLFGCFAEGPAEGLPDLSQECATMCAGQNDLSCYKATCETDCLAGMAEPLKCNGAFAGTVYCYAAQQDPEYICGMSQQPELIGDRCDFYDEVTFGCEND